MMGELLQLRNENIKLQAEVEVLTKQLQRIDENERNHKNQDSKRDLDINTNYDS